MFNLCLNALATYGRLVVIGMISQVEFSFFFFPMGFLLNSLVYFMPCFFFSFYQHHLQFLYNLCEKELISCCIN